MPLHGVRPVEAEPSWREKSGVRLEPEIKMSLLKNIVSNPGRRSFLRATVLAGLGGLGPTGRKPASGAAVEEAGLPDWVVRARQQIPATRESHYFQTGGIGVSPSPVIERVSELLQVQNRGPADPRFFRILKEAEDSCRPLVAETFGAREEEVGLTHNTTEALNIPIWSIDWKPGDELVISDQEHPALLMPTYNLHRRLGVRYRIAPIDLESDVVENVLRELSPRTRLVAISHVSRRSGLVVPGRDLAHALHERGVRLLLDGAQAAGNVPVRFHELECDYYSLCGHKWLMGPKGTGAVLIRKNLLATTPVSWTGAHSQTSHDDKGNFEWHPSARRYEFGTRAQAVFGGFAEALRWMRSLGRQNIHDRVAALSRRASRKIQKSGKFGLVSPSDEMSANGVVVLRLPQGHDAQEISAKLARSDHILVSSLPHPRDLRVCLHFFNTWGEFETLMSRLDTYCS